MIDCIKNLKNKCRIIREEMLKMCISAGKGHVTSSLSCVDILVALYHGGILNVDPQNPKADKRDRFILSKGQASPALYTILADRGFFDKRELRRFAQPNGKMAVHLQNDIPGVEITAGSLGQGYALAAGIALSLKLDRKLSLVYALLGDGECYEGSIWEAAMFIAHNKLNNLITIIDRNYLCVTDFTENLIELEPFEKKWISFGFNVIRLDGHDVENIIVELERLKSRPQRKPTVIIADTVKGYGVGSLCYDPLWHGCAPPAEKATQCINELLEGSENE
nr:transketolase [uncultured Desulfobacter sp.]